MESPQVASPVQPSLVGPFARSRSDTKIADDVTSLTSFNPFSEEDENDQSSYTLVTSLFSRMKNLIDAPLSSAVSVASGATVSNPNAPPNGAVGEQRKPSGVALAAPPPTSSSRNVSERPQSLTVTLSKPAQPLVSLPHAVSEAPYLAGEHDRSPSRTGNYYDDGALFAATTIPGFPIQDDTRSIRTSASVTIKRSDSVSKVIRRIRGEGLSRDYWMDDESCKECSDCQSVFTTWRRKHHCRICGQIFCSRCASSIIDGARFGHDGMIRVCNICVERLGKDDPDEEDDHRSIASTNSPFPAHQLSSESIYFGLGHHPQSPFAAAQLFGRTDEPFNLYSIAETKRPPSSLDGSRPGSHPITPGDMLSSPKSSWEPIYEISAPFRRGLSDEEKDPVTLSTSFTHDDLPPTTRAKTPIDFPVTVPISVEVLTTSSIQFPISSPEHHHGPDSPRPASRHRSRFNSYGDFDVATPFIRSRVQSRLENIVAGEPGWRTRRESTAYAQELNLTSMRHLKIMLRQMLATEKVPNIWEWEDTLLRLALRIARELTFTALPHRQGQDMDVRRYVKIKKIPGGAPSDSEYVNGAVITRNVAHKQMSRIQRNPRVMLVTFPLELSRVEGQYMHFGQIGRQEKEYLGNLASRIAALRPHVVLVEKSVSSLALEALAKHNIAVARAVKASAIQFVARMTQGDVFSSIDKLALEPRLGHCSRYRIQTFDHPLIPGQRKTYMRFEGCNQDMGCTIILRGGDIGTLRHIKKVTRFLTFVVRNLKLETHLWKDSVITLPSFNALATPAPDDASTSPPRSGFSSTSARPTLLSTSTTTQRMPQVTGVYDSAANDTEIDESLPNEDAEQLRLSRRIQASLVPYAKTFVSVSATLRFPAPQPIRRMKELDDELARARRAWEDEVVKQEEQGRAGHAQELTITLPTPNTPAPIPAPPPILVHDDGAQDQADINALIEALPTGDIPSTPVSRENGFPLPANFDGTSDYFEGSLTSASGSGSTILNGAPAVGPPAEDPTLVIKSVEEIAVESQLSLVKWQYEEYRRIWEWYLRKNEDDFVVEKYQCISVWQYTVPTSEIGLHRACFAPQLSYITFYGENDCTLGQFVEKSVADTLNHFLNPKAICAGKGCHQPLARHCVVYVHNETRLFVAVEQWDGQIVGLGNHSPLPDLITTWSACRICGSATPFIPVSEEMQRYSFAKFLELHFYPADVNIVQGAGCEHNIYQHHVRFFAYKGMTVRFQADPIGLHEVIYPPMRIRVRPESQLKIKNNDFQRLHRRNVLWYSALIDDLKLINIDAATGDEESDARLTADINILISRAEAEREEIARMINRVYKDSSATDTLALNQVRAFRQDRIVAWQLDFDRLPKPRPLPATVEKNGRKVSAFTSVRAMFPGKGDWASAFENVNVGSASVSEAEDFFWRLKMRRVTGESVNSSASETSEPETGLERRAPEVVQPADDHLEPSGKLDSPSADPAKSDPDSDSTIGAAKDEPMSSPLALQSPASIEQDTLGDKPVPMRDSRLPRRSVNQPSVAQLIQKYQDFLPAQGVRDLTKTALAPRPLISESDQEYSTPSVARSSVRTKTRHSSLVKKTSCSDFEQGYAASIAPRYLTHSRRSQGRAHNSRIPGPVLSSTESRCSSRQQSPDNRNANANAHPQTESKLGRASPGQTRPSTAVGGTRGRIKTPVRPAKDKYPARQPSNVSNKSFRRQPGPGSKVSNIAKHFERLNRENERANRRYAVIRGRRARPVVSARAKVEVLDSVKDAIKYGGSGSSESSSEADDEGDDNDECPKAVDGVYEKSSLELPAALPDVVIEPASCPPEGSARTANGIEPPEARSSGAQDPVFPTQELSSLPPSPSLQPAAVVSPSFTPPVAEESAPGATTSFLQTLGTWLQQPGRVRLDIDMDDLIGDPEHIFRDSSMVVRTDEPTSIIALALNSPQYRDMLAKSRAEKRVAREPKVADGGEAFMPDDRSLAESNSTWGVVNVESAESADPTEELRTPSSRLPWAISFESGGLTISCTVLYPEQFDALRRTYDCEKSMVESLARCVKWDARGGKSGSAFLKTRDDRFIAKEISRTELQTMETFAPAYFDYMSSAVTANRPTLLAKVFGCFKVTFKKSGKDKGPGKTRSTQMNLLVMENLFYDRSFTKIYDLKGSTRGRHVQSTGRENEVLLDENLVQTAHLSPFYLREHSKRILRGALYNDSKFLADINVMDYSLVVGVDSQKNELVVGIVDYIRTYTWDKRLETWVKESAFMGGGAKGEPTIVTPRQYRQRFISAMERYFPLIPDRWMKQKDTPEEDPNTLLELWPDW